MELIKADRLLSPHRSSRHEAFRYVTTDDTHEETALLRGSRGLLRIAVDNCGRVKNGGGGNRTARRRAVCSDQVPKIYGSVYGIVWR